MAAMWAARSMWGHGDYNADGYDDLALGTWFLDKVAILRGTWSGIRPAPRPRTTVAGPASSGFGNDLSAGDVNGDGHDDLLVGARDASSAYLYHGSAAVIGGSPARTFTGAAYSYMGLTVSVLGDTDGDGYDDVALHEDGTAVGGYAYVYDGSATGTEAVPQTLVGTDYGFSVGCELGQFGQSVAAIGDVNGDGYADLAVGGITPVSSCTSGSAYGNTYVFFGTP
jgi:hypothetical protein